MRKKRIVTIGGGTGQFMLLSELARHDDIDITAIVNMTDAGGSTGLLRDELGVLPAGDARQALVALSGAQDVWRELFTYRFSEGGLSGHTMGNLVLGALEKMTGSFEKSLEQASRILQTKGAVLPITLENSQLIIETHNDEIFYGEDRIDESVVANPRAIYFNKHTPINPKASKAIREADMVVICPGNFYCSIMPNLLIHGMHQALRDSRATKVFISNLVSKYGHTTDMTVVDFVSQAHKAVDYAFIDVLLYNTQLELRDKDLEEKYRQDGEHLIHPGDINSLSIKTIAKKFIAKEKHIPQKGDTVKRSLIRHDASKIVKELLQL
ncbi:MAG: gluconeogenesis factor YvcK family protein [Patescibacteria group bacterium]